MSDVESIFNTALERADPDQRRRYLDQACAGEPKLRARVEALLAAHGSARDFLDRPAVPQPPSREAVISEGPGDRIGDYVLRERLGEGGFGVVYRAEQGAPLRREVALKIIKLGMDTKQVIARFEAERQALALTDHPNIARVFDAGATESGRPYFVMELVRGIAVHSYCDRHRLPIPERLALFVDICRAVQHAHQKGLVHRDLKPSNVMVTVQDGRPCPKVIDFGVAKATTGRLTGVTLHTELGQLLGTPAYMSPEQAEMSGLDVDTRTDVYSLGVLLYELLTGSTPFDSRRLRDASLTEVQRILREEEPPSPSARVARLGEQLAPVARARAVDPPGALVGRLHGDLDWITLHALEKDRTRRYGTPDGLAADLTRHLQNVPVLAGPPSTLYVLGKFMRRNQVAVLAGAAVVLALLLGVAFAAWALVQVSGERDEAKLRLALLEDVVQNRYRDHDAREFVARARARFGEDHLMVAVTLALSAQSLQDQGELARAEQYRREALALWEGQDEGGINTALAHAGLGKLLLDRGHLEEALQHLDRARELSKVLRPRPTALLAEVELDRGALLQRRGEFALSADALSIALVYLRAVAPDEHGRLGRTLEQLAAMYEAAGEVSSAATARREATRELVRAFPDTLIAADQHLALGLSLARLPRLVAGEGEAERHLRSGLAIYHEQPGLKGTRYLTGLVGLAEILGAGSEPARQSESDDLWRDALAFAARLHGDSLEVAALYERRATQLEALGRIEEARVKHIEGLEISQRAAGDAIDAVGFLSSIADAVLGPGRGAAGEGALENGGPSGPRMEASEIEAVGRGLDLMLRVDPLAGLLYALPSAATRQAQRKQGMGQVTDLLAFAVLSAKMGQPGWGRLALERARPLAKGPAARENEVVARLLEEAEALLGN
jgi:serine/threonine protein kinase/tetratricopeptide (TPR) repeat protein